MAEFLVYNMENHMDRMTLERFKELSYERKNFLAKFNARYQRGDIIDKRPDGFWTDGKRKGFGYPKFALVCVKDLDDKATNLTTELRDVTGTTLFKRRRFRFNLDALQFNDKHIAVIKQSELTEKVTDKIMELPIG